MTNVVAVIPTIGEAPQLPALVDQLFADGCAEVLLVTNWPCRLPDVDPRAKRLAHSGTIYQSWNIGVHRLAERGAEAVAVLNDDVTLEEGALQLAAGALELDPALAIVGFDYAADSPPRHGVPLHYVSGSYRAGGVGGFAFVVRTRPFAYLGVDEQFEWWYGDDDLFHSTERAGWRLAVRVGAHVEHVSETTARNHPWTFEARARDAEKYVAKWGGM